MERDKIEKKYILITSMNFPSGGAGATYINLFCRGLKLNGRSISVVLLKGYAFGNFSYNGPRHNVSDEGIPYSYLGFKQRPGNQFLKLIDEFLSVCHLIIHLLSVILKDKNISLFIFNSEPQYNIPIILLSRIFKIKTTKFVAEFIDKSEFSGSFFGKIKRYGYIFNFNHLNKMADSLIVFSIYLKNEYINMGYDEKKIIVQPNLTDFEFWGSGNGKIKYTLGYSGAPYLKDGLHDLFKAMNLLHVEGIDVDLLIIGDATFGKSLLPGLKEECQGLGILEKVTFTGLVESSTVKQYLEECKFLTITRPSTTQTKAGFPTKLGEYFATRRPVLATNFGDMETYFADGKDIVMAECGNPESIALKIKFMLQNSSELELICARGYDRAHQLLEYKTSVNRMINFIESSGN
jgi:glycosyltransferase involved in cell wall biosynthesis